VYDDVTGSSLYLLCRSISRNDYLAMKIVTIASREPTEPYYCLPAFLESCRRFGHEPIVLKEGYGGLGSKLRMLKNCLDAAGSPLMLTGCMIFCDSFDVVFQQDPILCLKCWHPRRRRLVFNAERAMWPPNKEVEDGHPVSDTSYRFLNSGFIVGDVGTFRLCLDLLNTDQIEDDHQLPDGSWVHPNDQVIWQRFFVDNKDELGLALDTRAEICQTLCNVKPDELDFSAELIWNRETGTTPIAIHVNGGGKEEWLPLILGKLNLPR
jgi:hypothetical protein